MPGTQKAILGADTTLTKAKLCTCFKKNPSRSMKMIREYRRTGIEFYLQ